MKTELKWALIIAMSIFVWICLEFAVGLHDELVEWHPIVTNFALIIPFIGLFLALKEKRDTDLAGSISYGQAVKSGLVISVIIGVLSVPLQYLFHAVVNPDFFTVMVEHARVHYIEAGNTADEALELAEAHFNLGVYLWESAIGGAVGSFIASLIVSFFVKKNAPESIME